MCYGVAHPFPRVMSVRIKLQVGVMFRHVSSFYLSVAMPNAQFIPPDPLFCTSSCVLGYDISQLVFENRRRNQQTSHLLCGKQCRLDWIVLLCHFIETDLCTTIYLAYKTVLHVS